MTATAGLELGLDKHIHAQLCNEFPTIETYIRSTGEKQSNYARDQALAALDRYILANVAPPVQSGLLLFNAALSAIILPTGCPGVDNVLSGGLRTGHLTEFCGSTDTGKSTLCLLAALTTSMSGYRVEWLDTRNNFGSQRLHHLFQFRKEASQPNANERFMAALKLIKVRRAFQPQRLVDELDILSRQFDDEIAIEAPLPKLIIIDPFASLIVPMMGRDARSQGHTMLTILARGLKTLADRFQLAVLLTQHTTGSNPARPVLGDMWQSQPHARVELAGSQDTDKGSLRQATLTASQIRSCGVTSLFDLANLLSKADLP